MQLFVVAFITTVVVVIAILMERPHQQLLVDMACGDDGDVSTAKSKAGIDSSAAPHTTDMLAVGKPGGMKLVL